MKRKGFTLIEILVAVVIFGLIITIVISFFNSINTERKISIERSKINEKVAIIEKNIRDYISSSNLYLDSNSVDNINSNFNFIRPYYVPTAVIVPAIYETQSDQLILFYNYTPDTYIRVRGTQNRVVIEGSGTFNSNLRFVVIPPGYSQSFFYYFTLSNPIPENTWNNNRRETIIFDRPAFNNSNYMVSLIFRRQIVAQNGPIPPEIQDIIYQTHGNIRDTNLVPNQTITNPNLLYAEIRVGLYQNNRRRLFYTKIMNFYIRHKSII